MTHSETHTKRIKKLTLRVRAYADSEGIEPTTASFVVFDDGKELERLGGKGSTKPSTLEKYEYVIRKLEADAKSGVKTNRYARARTYATEFQGQAESAA